ncbi:class I SAM-dependent methyltransferase [bacterium]|nr:class I SAM-dependent methyltransferase [bacterium]
MKILDLGCGARTKMEGATGLDIRPAPHVDVVHDLNSYPYPFPEDEFDRIEASHIIEHIHRPLYFMNEIHRMAKPGATVRIITPHYSSQLSYGDLEHFHHFGYISFLTLQNTGLFHIKKHKLYFTDLYKVLGIQWLANLKPRRWEKYFCFRFPALYVEILFEIIKKENSQNRLIDKYMY